MADDVLINKAAAIERAVRRVREDYAGETRNLRDDPTRQDAIVMNLQRACESSIDAAMHLVRARRLGVPQETREAFVLLEQAHVIEAALADRLKKMVGFRKRRDPRLSASQSRYRRANRPRRLPRILADSIEVVSATRAGAPRPGSRHFMAPNPGRLVYRVGSRPATDDAG